MTLGAREEFRMYLLMYVKRLGAEGLRNKTQEMLRMLLGDVYANDEEGNEEGINVEDGEEVPKGWFTREEEICGWKRRELLREVVLILGEYFTVPSLSCFQYITRAEFLLTVSVQVNIVICSGLQFRMRGY
jgi:protein HIRA/HIR1